MEAMQMTQEWNELYRNHKVKNDNAATYYRCYRSLQLYNKDFICYAKELSQNPFHTVRRLDNYHMEHASSVLEQHLTDLTDDLKVAGLKDLSQVITKLSEILKKIVHTFISTSQELFMKAKHIEANNYSIKNDKYTDQTYQKLCKRCLREMEERLLQKMKGKMTRVMENNSRILQQEHNLDNIIQMNLQNRATLVTETQIQLKNQQEDDSQTSSHNILQSKNLIRTSTIKRSATVKINHCLKSSKKQSQRCSFQSVSSNQHSSGKQLNILVQNKTRNSLRKSKKFSIFATNQEPNEQIKQSIFASQFQWKKIENRQIIQGPSHEKKIQNFEKKIKELQQRETKLKRQQIIMEIENTGLKEQLKMHQEADKTIQIQKLKRNFHRKQSSPKSQPNQQKFKITDRKLRKTVQGQEKASFFETQLNSKKTKMIVSKTLNINRMKLGKQNIHSPRNNQSIVRLQNERIKSIENWSKQTLKSLKKQGHQKFLSNLQVQSRFRNSDLINVSNNPGFQVQLGHVSRTFLKTNFRSTKGKAELRAKINYNFIQQNDLVTSAGTFRLKTHKRSSPLKS